MIINFLKGMVLFLPSSKSLSYYWNFGMMLGLVLSFQLVSGLILVFYYLPSSSLSFFSVQYVMIETFMGWLIRILHFNGASLFFIFLYLHFFKALFYGSWRLTKVWFSGLTILIFSMLIAFLGYVLVWAQMSFWASIVITSLLSVLPWIGPSLVFWIWGGFNVGSSTLSFFFSMHFIIPWVLLVFVIFHLSFLHDTGSTSKIYCHGDYDKIFFFSFFWWKDSLNIFIFLVFFIFAIFNPFFFGDPEMFLESNPMVSPVHIVPEWYFLFVYAILRSIPNKVLGVIVMLFSLLIFYFFGFIQSYVSFLSVFNKYFFYLFLFGFLLLSWLGQCLVEDPFILFGLLCSFFYFFIIILCLFIFYFSKIMFLSSFIMSKMY